MMTKDLNRFILCNILKHYQDYMLTIQNHNERQI